MNIKVAWQAGLAGSILIGLALIARSIGTYLCLIGSSFTMAERMFIVISYIPKATVQAAIGGAPLLAMQAAGMDTRPGQVILAVAVLSILLTAPVGAWAISLSGNRILKQENKLPASKEGITVVSEGEIASFIRVDKIMECDIKPIRETQTLKDVFHMFSESDFITCPIIDTHSRFIGIIRLDDLRPLLLSHHTLEWFIAADVYHTLENIPTTDSSLKSSLRMMSDVNLREIPVIESGTQKVAGILNYEKAQRFIKEKWIEMNNSNNLHQAESESA